MTKKLAIVIHRVTDEVICTNSKTDLATILGVSFSTVIRKYSKSGKYESGVYIIYIGIEMYKNNKDKNYKHDVTPPTVKTYNNTQRTITPNKSIKMNDFDHISIQPIIEDEPLSTDWRVIEKNLSISEYDEYYSKRTIEQLKDSAKYFAHKPYHMKYINKYGQLRELE